jgi:nucleotide-binding universal stress UspA family protein
VKRIRRILHATDYSKASGRALSEAIDLAKQNKAELLLVHVIVPVAPYVAGDQYTGPELYVQLEQASKRDAEAGMKKLMAKVKKAKVKAKSLLLKGSSHDQIVAAAKRQKADLIVIGTHGRTGISKLFLGSVAGRVIATAHCPVLTVRGR